MPTLGIKVVADVSTEAGQVDFAADVDKVKASNAGAAFVYLNEDESARILKEFKRQNVTTPLIGETTLVGQKVIELAGDAANGARGPCRPDDRRAGRSGQALSATALSRNTITSPTTTGMKGYLAI